MPSLYRARIDALLAACTANIGEHTVITDLDMLTHGIGDLIDECIDERIDDVLRERAGD
jgi:hypothetical protein